MMTLVGAFSSCRIALLHRQRHVSEFARQLRHVCRGGRYTALMSVFYGRRHLSAGHSDTDAVPPPPPPGRVFDCKPAHVQLEAGKMYGWCTCGHSNKQPMCDGAHKAVNESTDDRQSAPYRSHKFQVDENKEFVLCNCKQTSNRPFCDGTHKLQWIQDSAAAAAVK